MNYVIWPVLAHLLLFLLENGYPANMQKITNYQGGKTMKPYTRTIKLALSVAFLFICLLPSVVMAAGLLKPLDKKDENSVKIKSHHVDVVINNGFAQTKVEQVFFNSGSHDLEAIYSFPLPKQASLSEVSLWIGGKEVIGEVLAKEKAKKVYEEQKAKGNDTALAEKNDYKTFDVKVWPVKANGETKVRLVYYQPLEIHLNVGRYVYPLEQGGVDDERISFSEVKETFAFNLTLKSSFPVKDVRLPHYENKAVINASGKGSKQETYTVNLDFKEGATLSNDVVFYYRLEYTTPARVELIPYKADKQGEGTFMAVVTPGASLKPIQNGTDWTFVLDVSGSMAGGKINSLVDGVSKVIGKMGANDRFRIVTFNDRAEEFSGGYITATAENVRNALAKISSISANGGKDLYSGLAKAYKGLEADRITGIVLVTDGVANIGTTQHSAMLDLIRKNDYRLFTFVIGNSANQPLLSNLAEESGGFAMNFSSREYIAGWIIRAKAKVLHECIYDAKLKFHGDSVKDITPSFAGNLYMGQQLVLFGKYKRHGAVKLEFTGKVGNVEKSWVCQTVLPEKDTSNPEIERLWALSSIEDEMKKIRMEGESNPLMNRIVKLGTEYSLVTDYTSMVVLNDAEMEVMGMKRSNTDIVSRERATKAGQIITPSYYFPEWILTPPQGVYTVGSEKVGTGSLKIARDSAIGKGHSEMPKTIVLKTKRIVRTLTKSIGIDDSQISDKILTNVSEQVLKVEISNYVMKKLFLDEKDRILYALITLKPTTVSQLRDVIKQGVLNCLKNDHGIWQKFQTNKGYEKLEKAIEKEFGELRTPPPVTQYRKPNSKDLFAIASPDDSEIDKKKAKIVYRMSSLIYGYSVICERCSPNQWADMSETIKRFELEYPELIMLIKKSPYFERAMRRVNSEIETPCTSHEGCETAIRMLQQFIDAPTGRHEMLELIEVLKK